jgi:hypothetical protein
VQHFQRSTNWEDDVLDCIFYSVHFTPLEPLSETLAQRFLHEGHNVVRGIVLEIDLDGGY